MQKIKYAVVGWCAGLLWLLPLAALASPVQITHVSSSATAGGERVQLHTNIPLQHTRLIELANPPRVAIDFPRLHGAQVALPAGYAGRALRAIRFGQFDAATSRVVLDMAVAPEEVAVSSVSSPAGVVIDIRLPAGQSKAPVQPAVTSAAAGANPTAIVAPPASIYSQASDEKPLIVIDAGHGGQDPGAIGARQTQEKNVTLAMARTLKELLLRTGRYRVALTRDDDRFIMLAERVNIARRLKADIFISLHADSNPVASARGVSVYTISDTASDEEAAALARRENAVDDLSGMDLGAVDKDVADILIDLAARETRAKSSSLADMMIEALHPKIPRLTRPHRFAGFRVLKAPDTPSVLIEMGFLTNSSDEVQLSSPEYRELLAASLRKGLDAYFVTTKRR